MTAIKTKQSAEATSQDAGTVQRQPRPAMPPSTTEDEARKRFVSALSTGVDKLLERGHGRDRASAELLNEIADGCSPDDNEVGIYLFIYLLCFF